jgi:sialic acid synthase SpsE
MKVFKQTRLSFKIPSGEITNYPYLKAVAIQTHIMSTGMPESETRRQMSFLNLTSTLFHYIVILNNNQHQ